MSKEYVWTMSVDDVSVPWKCVVTDDECITYEGDVQTNRLKITNPQKKQGVLQVNEEILVYGKECGFQLENDIPYIKIDNKWAMSETTMEDRQEKMKKNQKISSLVQLIAGIAMCLVVLIVYLVTKDVRNLWICAIIGSMMAVMGGFQLYQINKGNFM